MKIGLVRHKLGSPAEQASCKYLQDLLFYIHTQAVSASLATSISGLYLLWGLDLEIPFRVLGRDAVIAYKNNR